MQVIISSGLLCGTMLAGYMVSKGHLTVGDFVLFIAYMLQLYVGRPRLMSLMTGVFFSPLVLSVLA